MNLVRRVFYLSQRGTNLRSLSVPHFAECVADLGLRRGIAKEVRKQKGEKTHHEPLWRWKAKQVEQKEKELQELNEAICKKKEQLEKDRAKEVEEILSDIFDEER